MMVEAGDADGLISGPHPVLPRDDPPGPPDRRHPPRRPAGLRRLHPDPPGPHLLPRRHHGEHRPDRRGAGRDRPAHRRASPAASTSSRGSPCSRSRTSARTPTPRRARCAAPSRSSRALEPGPGDRRRDAGRHRGLRADPRRRATPGAGCRQPANVLIFPEPAVGQHRLQADLAARRRRGDRADPAGDGASRSTSSRAAST